VIKKQIWNLLKEQKLKDIYLTKKIYINLLKEKYLKNLISLGIVFLFIKAIKYSKIEKLKNMYLKKRKTSIDEISVLLILQK
jgi:hypothetical protein